MKLLKNVTIQPTRVMAEEIFFLIFGFECLRDHENLETDKFNTVCINHKPMTLHLSVGFSCWTCNNDKLNLKKKWISYAVRSF